MGIPASTLQAPVGLQKQKKAKKMQSIGSNTPNLPLLVFCENEYRYSL